MWLRIRQRILSPSLFLCIGMSTAVGVTSAEAQDPPEPPPLQGRIVFTSDRDGDFDIYIKNAAGGGLEQVTFNGKNEYEPRWSPDGRWIAFWRYVSPPGFSDIFIKEIGGGPAVPLTRSKGIYERGPSWSPDGKWILFTWDTTDGSYVRALNVETGEEEIVASSRQSSQMEEGTWAPSGDRVAFVEYESEFSASSMFLGSFPSMYSDEEALSEPTRREINLDWSPVGDQILFAGAEDEDVDWNMYILDIASGELLVLDEDPSVASLPGSWSPDGKRVAFYKDAVDKFDIYFLDLETREVAQFTTNKADDRHPDWTASTSSD